jgi:hypothetical protein
MANKAKKPRAKRSIRSGKKTAQLINNNQEIIYNVWTILNSQQVLKNF